MRKRFYIIIASLILTLFKLGVYAQDEAPILPFPEDIKIEIVDSLTQDYYSWDKLSMSGKLSSPLLPVTASVKVYMEKEKLILISLSVFLKGEVARIEIDEKEALLINKLNNTYTAIGMDMIEQVCPGGLRALQNLLLGRVTLMGQGELSQRNSKFVEMYENIEGNIVLLPDQDMNTAPYVYFYTLNGVNFDLMTFSVLSQDGESEAVCNFTQREKDLTLSMMAMINSKGLEATLKLNQPDSNSKPLSRFNLTSKYRKTDLRGIFK